MDATIIAAKATANIQTGADFASSPAIIGFVGVGGECDVARGECFVVVSIRLIFVDALIAGKRIGRGGRVGKRVDVLSGALVVVP